MIGVSFQPGAQGFAGQQKPQNGTGTGGGVQEAIRVLSLRLPRVVGAQGIAPQALLESPGSNGSRVDSVVNQVLAKFFPNAAPMQSAQSFGTAPTFDPNQGAQQPTFTPDVQYANPFMGGARREAPSIDTTTFLRPRVIFENPTMPAGDFTVGAGGRPKTSPFGGGIFESLPGTDHQQRPAAIAPTPQWPPFGGGESTPDRPYEF